MFRIISGIFSKQPEDILLRSASWSAIEITSSQIPGLQLRRNGGEKGYRSIMSLS
jgi:hypothetical protein